jgi:hypothetical protein
MESGGLVSHAPYVNEEGANEVDESQTHDTAMSFPAFSHTFAHRVPTGSRYRIHNQDEENNIQYL